MKKILFVMLAMTLLAMPAMASVQSVKVSGDIESTYIIRDNFDFAGNSQNVAISQARLRIDADLTDKVSATIALINERAWGNDTATTTTNSTEVDLNLAYVTMREMLYSPLTVTLGRQAFAFGNSFVISSAGGASSAATGLANVASDLTKQTAKDAVRLTFDYDPLTIDVLYASIDQGLVGFNQKEDDADLYGINASYQFNDEKSSLVEGYFWVKEDKTAGKSKIYMPGVRGSMNILDGWNLQAEVAAQMGDIEDLSKEYDRRAYAAQVLSNYMLPFEKTEKYQPVLGLSYTVFSGDKYDDAGDYGDYTAWDPMYEDQAGGKIFNVLYPATNCHTLGGSLTFVPMEDVVANVYTDYLWLDKEWKEPTAFGSELEEQELGMEAGLVLTYDYTEDVQFGARAGWFFPGNRYNNDSEKASQILLNAKVAF